MKKIWVKVNLEGLDDCFILVNNEVYVLCKCMQREMRERMVGIEGERNLFYYNILEQLCEFCIIVFIEINNIIRNEIRIFLIGGYYFCEFLLEIEGGVGIRMVVIIIYFI